jgi:lactoylglutathione lyase
MIRRLAHICFVTNQLDRMVEFYSKGLGLPVKFDFRNAEGQVFGCYLECGDSTFLEIFDRALMTQQWGGEMAESVKGNQITHLALEVTGLADFKAALERKGLKLRDIVTGMDHSLQSWTNDPDGNAIEFIDFQGLGDTAAPAYGGRERRVPKSHLA